MLVALLSVAEEFVRQNHLGGIPPFMEFDRDQRFLLLLFLLTGSGEPLPRPREDELLGNLYLPENDSLAVNAAIRSPDLHEVGAARPHIIELDVARRIVRIVAAHPLL